MKNMIDAPVAIGNYNKLKNMDPEEHAKNVWLMYIASDLLVEAAMNLESVLKVANKWTHQDKRDIKTVRRIAERFISEVDRNADMERSEIFANISEDCLNKVMGILSKRNEYAKDKDNTGRE